MSGVGTSSYFLPPTTHPPLPPPHRYHGHTLPHLAQLRSQLAANNKNSNTRFVYFCGDSSLDNKHWFFDGFETKASQMHKAAFTADAVNGFEDVLDPPRMVKV